MKATPIVTIRNCSYPFPYINSFYSKTKISFKGVGTIIVLIRQMRKQHRQAKCVFQGHIHVELRRYRKC